MDIQQSQFVTIKSKTGNSQRKPHPFEDILSQCKTIEQNLVTQHLKKTIDEIRTQCKDEIQIQIKNQIFPVAFRKNQEEQLKQFLSLLQKQFKNKKNEIFEDCDPSKIEIIYLSGSQVRQIVFQMYCFIDQNPQFELIVFISRYITDLSQHNIYCFQKGLKNKKFVAILCTQEFFDYDQQSKHSNFQKYHIFLYNPKELFCLFVYKCLCSQIIKPYLPPQILNLISDMDFYAISFRQSCRRFIYCLERYLMLTKERKYVQFQSLLTLIDQKISKKFQFYQGYKPSHQKILKVILCQKEMYTISQKCLSMQIAMKPCQQKIEEIDIMNSIRASLIKGFRNQSFQQYIVYLQDKQEDEVVQRVLIKKKTRSDKLGIDTKKNITPKNKLQNQITKIIKHATVQIRLQATAINWADLKYQMRIRPQIPYNIVLALKDTDELTRTITQQILNHYTVPLSYLLNISSQQDIGKIMYILKELQLIGLISYSKKQSKPIVYNNYFQKKTFSLLNNDR